MPLYEYECETCGIHFERRERMSDKPLPVCPECSGPVHRLIQPVGIIFKGSGFYCTDHRSGSNAVSSSSKSEGKSESGGEKKEKASDSGS